MSNAIFQLLAQRFAPPEWVIVPQVRDGTGFTASRTADAVAMNCYPSKGLEVHGFEFKVSRGDWLRELRDGSKAEAVAQHCDRWWIVAPDGIVVRAELPKTWGLIVVKDDAIRTAVAAPPLPSADGPLDRSFVASFLRGCLERSKAPSEEALQAQFRAGAAAERKRAAESEKQSAALASDTAARFRESIEAFEAASGVHINSWDGGNVGRAFRAFQEMRGGRGFDVFEYQAGELRKMADRLDAMRGTIEAERPSLDANETGPPT